MTTLECSVCLEPFARDINPPMSLVPCGHEICQPCLEQWQRQSTQRRMKTCPMCRTRVESQHLNRGLMDAIEMHNGANSNNGTNNNGQGPSTPPNPSGGTSQNIFESGLRATASLVDQDENVPAFVTALKEKNEIIQDKTEIMYCVIDNSGSMGCSDGKIFDSVPSQNGQGTELRKIGGNTRYGFSSGEVTRWQEACHKCNQIAKYNVQRSMKAFYYLLNPRQPNRWVEDLDYVEIDPLALYQANSSFEGKEYNTENVTKACQAKLDILKNTLLQKKNIRGATPLDSITRHLQSKLHSTYSSTKNVAINYNVVTDGLPNDARVFENQLRNLAKTQTIFLTINLCTDDDSVVDYYNSLDTKIGGELSGMDVIDDLEGEQKEIMKAGNTFLTYYDDLHICRMAGCNSVLADVLDEGSMSSFHMTKLVRQLLKLDSNPAHYSAMWYEDTEGFLKLVRESNKMVYNLYYRKQTPLIDENKVARNINWQKSTQDYSKFYNENIQPYSSYLLIAFLIILYAIIANPN